jgi:hypothetical protein
MDMGELKTLALVGVGLLFLSAVIDVILLTMHANGTVFALAIVFVGVIGSVAMVLINRYYESLERRRRREATLLLR